MKHNILNGILAFAFVTVVLSGCSQQNPLDVSTSANGSFLAVINGVDSATANLVHSAELVLNDNGKMFSLTHAISGNGGISVNGDNGFIAQQFGETISSVSRTITSVTSVSDNVKLVTAEITMAGELTVIGTTSSGAADTLHKMFTETLDRVFRFVNVNASAGGSGSSSAVWKLDAVSVLNGATGNASVAVSSVQLNASNGSSLNVTNSGGSALSLLLGTSGSGQGVPNIGSSGSLNVTATLESATRDTNLVVLHSMTAGGSVQMQQMSLVSQVQTASGFTSTYQATLALPASDTKFSSIAVSATSASSLTSTTSANVSSSVMGLPIKTSQ